MNQFKPVIGISCGDLNGIGTELIIKTFSDSRILEQCTPLIFSSNRVINFYKKTIPDIPFNFLSTREFNRISPKQVNLFNCWEEEIAINPGQLTELSGKYALLSLQTAVAALKQKFIDGLVTAPIHKKNIQSPAFQFSGHTPYLRHEFGAGEAVMMLYSGNFRIALVTEHIPLADVAKQITKGVITRKLGVLNQCLQKDFGINKPRIAVLGLNPHAGDEGLIGTEEDQVIKPDIREAKNNNIIAVGPYSPDAFFARRSFEKFDAVLALYHDQGLIPFKSLSTDSGVNYTAGLPVVRTSPDHGVAFDIAGKGIADPTSFVTAVFECIDIIKRRKEYEEQRKNPLKKMTSSLLGNEKDEIIEEGS